MKISAVCEQTGLTDRTVRFYTEEGLLNPSFTKNYLGRKTFDFSEEDVAMLKNIAVLRKYGFAIPEIKSILEDPAKSVEIIEALRQKKQETIHSEQELLDALLALEQGRAYTVPELAEALNTPKLEKKGLPEEPKEDWFLLLCKLFFWVQCAPLSLMVLFGLPSMLYQWENTFLYKKYYDDFGTYVLCAMGWFLPVLCAAAMIYLEAKWGKMKQQTRKNLMVSLTLFHTFVIWGCIMVAMVVATDPPYYSETEDVDHYMILGYMERGKMGSTLEQLFPDQIPEYALAQNGNPNPDSTRYYNYVGKQWDSEFELYAQWQLTEDDLAAEKMRIRHELGERITAEGQLGQWEYWSFRMDPVLWIEKPTDHIWESQERSCLFFAFNEETGMVRYIASYADEYRLEPAFCSLDWN